MTVYIATKDAVIGTDAGPVTVRRGITRVAEGHALLGSHPEFFRSADEDVHFGAPETTRQEPSVPRSRSKKKTADKG